MSSGLEAFFGPMCCICFTSLTPSTCWTDATGQRWDICATGPCAKRAGMTNEPACCDEIPRGDDGGEWDDPTPRPPR